MEMNGNREIAAPKDQVWAALNDPEILKACIPGCQELSGSAEEGFSATVKQKVGPVSATFKGHVELSDVVPGESYTISGEGKGGAAGFAKGGADVRLEETDGGTRLTYDVKASVGGKLAQLGSRLIDGFSKKMADQFFENFQQAVEGRRTGGAGRAGGRHGGRGAGEEEGLAGPRDGREGLNPGAGSGFEEASKVGRK